MDKILLRFSQNLVVEGVSNPKAKIRSNSESVLLKPTFKICGRKHYGRCIDDTKDCYGCDGSDHKTRDFQYLPLGGRKRNKIRSDALQSRGEEECPPYVDPSICFMLTFI